MSRMHDCVHIKVEEFFDMGIRWKDEFCVKRGVRPNTLLCEMCSYFKSYKG